MKFGRGVSVMAELAPINFTRGVPANESFPTDELIAAATATLQQHGAEILQYGPSRGFAPLRPSCPLRVLKRAAASDAALRRSVQAIP
jgi:2-aminoadipate transaminase